MLRRSRSIMAPYVGISGGFVPKQPPLSGGGAPPPGGTTLTLTMTDSADPVLGGGNFSYALIAQNTGAVNANAVIVKVTVDAALVIVSAVGAGWAVVQAGQVLTISRALLATGATAPTITVTVTAPAANTNVNSLGSVIANNAPIFNTSQATEIVVINRDGPQNAMYPLTQPEFQLWPLGVPSFVFLQGSPGPSIVDQVQATAVALIGTGVGISWQQVEAGWVGTFFKTTDGQASAGTMADLQTLWNLFCQNVTLLFWARVQTVAQRRVLFTLGDSEERIDVTNDGKLSLTRNNHAGVINYKDGLVHPFMVDWQPPADNLNHGPGLFNVGTDKELVVGTASLPASSGLVGFGAAGTSGENSLGGSYGACYGWCGTKANTQQATTQKARLQSIGVNVVY